MPLPAPLPVVAIVGRPNVGKSTLFNRIRGEKQAVVHPTPGVTRDRNYGEAEHKRRHFFLVDTGGFEPESQEKLLVQMREQTLLAVEEADAIVFLADVREPDNPADDEIIQVLRRSRKPIFLAVNKCDSHRHEDEAYALARFGFDRIYPLSAIHGTGVLDLLDDLLEALPDAPVTEHEGPLATRIAVVGRQNAGKSTLLNRLLGQERVIANPTAGTTRDAIDTYFEREGKLYCLIDTAGIRRRGRIERGIEHLSVVSAVLALQRCDVAILVVDAERGIEAQDTHIAGAIAENWKPCIIALNKWDLIEKDNSTYNAFVKKAREEFKFLPHAKIETFSALSGQRCHKIWSLIDNCVEQARRRVPTADLNRVLQAALYRVTPPAFAGHVLRVKYATQVAVNPPTFVLFVNDPKLMHFSYERYLLNRLREAFGFEGTPIRLLYRRKSPPEGWEQYVKLREGLRQRGSFRRKPGEEEPGLEPASEEPTAWWPGQDTGDAEEEGFEVEWSEGEEDDREEEEDWEEWEDDEDDEEFDGGTAKEYEEDTDEAMASRDGLENGGIRGPGARETSVDEMTNAQLAAGPAPRKSGGPDRLKGKPKTAGSKSPAGRPQRKPKPKGRSSPKHGGTGKKSDRGRAKKSERGGKSRPGKKKR